jgi:hypothetical protein
MLIDETWAKIAKKDETLCAYCFFARSIERRLDIRLSDLLDCEYNRFHSPSSWWNLFSEREERLCSHLGDATAQ